MLKSLTVCCFLGVLTSAALAQSDKPPVEPPKPGASQPAREEAVQERRASLRATLKSQPDGAVKRAIDSNAVRQLNTQERAELRQQLRRQ